ncbi:MAG: APC family permease [Halanaeroarchaeum sp.]
MSGDGDADGRLHRELGVVDAVLLSVGGMVGASIFYYPGATGKAVGPAAILAWVAMGGLMIAVGLLYAELALAFPRAGGPAVYPFETLGPNRTIRAFASYLEGISYSFGWTFAVTVSALSIASYLSITFPAASGYTVPIAVLAVVASFLVNLVGVHSTSRTNLVLAAVLLTVLLVFVGAGLANAAPANYDPFFTGDAGSFFAAMGFAMTGYGAWTAIPAAAEEIENPSRTVPLAIVLSLGITTVLYAAVLLALHGVVPPSQFTDGTILQAPLGVAAANLGATWLAKYVLPAGAIVAIFTTMLVGTMSASRVLLAMGRTGGLPSAFARIHPRFDTPWVGLLAVSLLAAGFATVPRYFYELETIAALVGTAIPYGINILAFLGLRYYRTDVTPSFRAPGGIALAAVAFLVVLVAIVGLGTTNVLWSLGALAVMTGYYAVRKFHADDATVAPAD